MKSPTVPLVILTLIESCIEMALPNSRQADLHPYIRSEGQTTPESEGTPTVRVFVESRAPPPQMWIFGAVDFTAALARVAKILGYRVLVCDAREMVTGRRFPMADEVRVNWPSPAFDERGETSSREMRSAFLPTIPNLMSRRCRVRLLPVLVIPSHGQSQFTMNVGLNDLLRPGSHRIMTLSG